MILIAACAAALLSACGGDTTNNLTADNEGVYVDIGHLKYQVQLSRELNPYDPEDSSYLLGLSPKAAALSPTQSWFGVFLIAFNRHSQSYAAAHDFYITDTQGAVYRPTPVPGPNPFAYHSAIVPGNNQLPVIGSTADDGPTNGLALLFKVPVSAYDNRPLTLHIVDPNNPQTIATVELDV
jgi:hypothetical protein